MTASRPARAFVALSFALSWGLALAFYALGGRLGSPLAPLMLVAYMFGPAVAAFVVQRFVVREPLRALGLRLGLGRAWLLAFLFPLAVVFGGMGLSMLVPGVRLSWGMEGFYHSLARTLPPVQVAEVKRSLEAMPLHPFWLGLVQAFVAGPTINALAAFGEELGWRGLLFRETARMGPWRGSVAIGLVWGLWHAPIILQGYNFPDHPAAGVLLFTLFTVGLSPLIGFVRLRTGSVFAASVCHGFLNAVATLPPLVMMGGDDLTTGSAGFPVLAALALLNLALFAALRSRPALLDAPAPRAEPGVG